MNMYRCEIFKIRSRKIVKICLLLLLAWFLFFFYVSCVSGDNSGCVIDGIRYQAQEDIKFYSGEDPNAVNMEKMLSIKPYFAYMQGWENLYETAGMIILLLNFVITIAIANVFTEEYSLHTAPILLTTQNGKKRGIQAKIGASFTFSAVMYLITGIIMILTYLLFFGTDGLNASACLSTWVRWSWTGIFGNTMGALLAELFLWGFISVLMNTYITLCVSAVCRQPFISILSSLAVLGFPILYDKVLYGLLPPVLLTRIIRIMTNWLPVYLPARGNETSFPDKWLMVLFIMPISVTTLLIGNWKYRNYQDVG